MGRYLCKICLKQPRTQKFLTEPSTPALPSEIIQVLREDLGVETIEGQSLRHGRETTQMPTSFAPDHKPFTIVMDYWYEQDLQSFVRIVRHGPNGSVQTVLLRDVHREKPPASLFRIPAGYHVKRIYPDNSPLQGYCPVP